MAVKSIGTSCVWIPTACQSAGDDLQEVWLPSDLGNGEDVDCRVAELRRIAGSLQELFRSVWVVGRAVPDRIEAVVQICQGKIASTRLGESFEEGITQLLAIDGNVHGFADTLIRSWALLIPVADQEQRGQG